MSGILEFIRWQDFIDILVIAFIVYRLLLLLMDTRAMQLVKGLFVIGLLYATARFLKLAALTWILGRLLGVFILAVPIVFQPEIRRMLEELGRGSIWRRRQTEEWASQLTEEITRALLFLQSRKIGALLVFQKDTGLKDIWRSAVQIDGDVSQDLIISIFWPGNPLHDGAVILDSRKVIAAACYLPLTENSNLSRWIGTRHRAALGVSEVSDAMALVVSEERGEVALAINGHLSRELKEGQIRRLLMHYFTHAAGPATADEGIRERLGSVFARGGSDKDEID